MSWKFVGKSLTLALHELLLSMFGGAPGLLNEGALESALSRPLHALSYGTPDAADLAASYLFGLARSHAFVDGNKRVALAVACVFLRDNGFDFRFDDGEAVVIVNLIASGGMVEDDIAAWIRPKLAHQ